MILDALTLELGAIVVGVTVAIVRIEQNARNGREIGKELQANMRTQHVELGQRIDTLFGQTRHHGEKVAGLDVKVVSIEQRTDRNERSLDGLIDKCGPPIPARRG